MEVEEVMNYELKVLSQVRLCPGRRSAFDRLLFGLLFLACLIYLARKALGVFFVPVSITTFGLSIGNT
jgi:hypothetical protein